MLCILHRWIHGRTRVRMLKFSSRHTGIWHRFPNRNKPHATIPDSFRTGPRHTRMSLHIQHKRLIKMWNWMALDGSVFVASNPFSCRSVISFVLLALSFSLLSINALKGVPAKLSYSCDFLLRCLPKLLAVGLLLPCLGQQYFLLVYMISGVRGEPGAGR